MVEAESDGMNSVSSLKIEERRKGMRWTDAQGDEKEKERLCLQNDGQLLPKAKSAVILLFCLLQCDVLQAEEWIMMWDRAQAQNMPAWKTLAEWMNRAKER